MKFYPVAELSGGLNVKQAPWMLADNQCTVAENCDFWTQLGAILGRKPYRLANSTPLVGKVVSFYRWVKSSGDSYLVAQTDAGTERRIYYSLDNTTFSLLAVGCPSGYKVTFVDYEDWLYMLDFNFTPMKWDGINQPQQWGMEAPAKAPVAVSGGPGNLTGTYTWKIVYKNAESYLSPNSPISHSLDLNSEQVTLTLPISTDPQVIKKQIYRQGGLLTDYYKVDEVDNSVETYTDNIADIDLTDLLDPYDRYPCPQSKHGAVHLNRIFVGNLVTKPHCFTWARARKPENFYDPAGSDPVGVKGRDIMGVVEYAETLFLLKEDSIYALRGGNESTFYLEPTYAIDGVVSEDSIMNVGTGIGYASTPGYFMFNSVSSKKVSDKVDPIWDGIDRSLLTNIMAAFDTRKKRAYVSYPKKALNDRILLFEMQSGAIHEWVIPHTALYYDNDRHITILGDADGNIFELEAEYPTESSYEFKWKSKSYDLGNPRLYKILYRIKMTLDTQDQDVKVSLWADHQRLVDGDVQVKGDWIELRTDQGIKGLNFQIQIEGTLTKPIKIIPPLVFQYEVTDVKTANVLPARAPTVIDSEPPDIVE